ncbi:hypothetical protein R1L06_05205 [Stenotrophomonas sp. C4297]|uniref:hypothetical protein n=1 Tax=Stenotrophomonas sp. C4297 TaxID=3077847 RepID=UPI00293CD94D|nr:hypothetical protein [Stenotrophomonas sp. C4297]MDV3510113.1 hypothetical protein [Stenotrophomonas sp. C4297]
MSESLKGKRVLFIAPMFFGYEKLIKAELEQQGAQVDFHPDRPGADFLTKALIRIDRRLLARRIAKHYRGIVEAAAGSQYDHVLVIRGEAISPQIIAQLRATQSTAKLTLYLWDSMHYNPNARLIKPYFDSVLSFDRVDVSENSEIEFLPLFFANEYARAAEWRGEYEYDACFIGTIHTDRYRILEKLLESLERDGRRVFVYCYYPSRVLHRLRSLVDPGFRRFSKKYVNFVGLPLSKVVDYISVSRCVIDINRPDQKGLTMRTIEALGAQRKLITTNEDVSSYDLYSSSAVKIVDRVAPVVQDEFLTASHRPFDDAVRTRYTVGNWVRQALLQPRAANEITKIGVE